MSLYSSVRERPRHIGKHVFGGGLASACQLGAIARTLKYSSGFSSGVRFCLCTALDMLRQCGYCSTRFVSFSTFLCPSDRTRWHCRCRHIVLSLSVVQGKYSCSCSWLRTRGLVVMWLRHHVAVARRGLVCCAM